MNKITVIHHSADFDGIFCREISKKFLGTENVEYVGWDFKDKPLGLPEGDGPIYILDLPCDRVFGFQYKRNELGVYSIAFEKDVDQKFMHDGYALTDLARRRIWIDHHKSSIDSHPPDIAGYRIDGVSACRLAWQWFYISEHNAQNSTNEALKRSLPGKHDFYDRRVSEPLAVRLAGEYDIFDKRDPRAELFQHGLRSRDLTGWWEGMLSDEATASVAEIENRLDQGSKFELLPNGNIKVPGLGERMVKSLLKSGEVVQFVRANEYREVITQQGFDLEFEGIKFLACNSHELDIRSHLFEAGIRPEHQALLGFTYNGQSRDWRISMYQIPGKHADILSIAKKYKGGGHPGACGFRMEGQTPFVNKTP